MNEKIKWGHPKQCFKAIDIGIEDPNETQQILNSILSRGLLSAKEQGVSKSLLTKRDEISVLSSSNCSNIKDVAAKFSIRLMKSTCLLIINSNHNKSKQKGTTHPVISGSVIPIKDRIIEALVIDDTQLALHEIKNIINRNHKRTPIFNKQMQILYMPNL